MNYTPRQSGVISGYRAELIEITQQFNALSDRMGVLYAGCEAESTRLLDTEPPSFLMLGINWALRGGS